MSFSEEDRKENIRRISEVAKLFLNCGIITINCFVSPTESIRGIARSIIGEEDYLEIFVDTSLEVCEERDTKGLYAKARAGEIENFTGVNAPFEVPERPGLKVKTENMTIEESAKVILDHILPIVQLRS